MTPIYVFCCYANSCRFLNIVQSTFDLFFSLSAIYDCTNLSGALPGFGTFDKTFFGVSLNNSFPIIPIRVLLWTVLGVTVARSTTHPLAWQALLFAGTAYLVAYAIGELIFARV